MCILINNVDYQCRKIVNVANVGTSLNTGHNIETGVLGQVWFQLVEVLAYLGQVDIPPFIMAGLVLKYNHEGLKSSLL